MVKKMNNKIILSLLFTILISSPIFAFDCQYTESVFDRVETKIIAYSKDLDDPIKPITFYIIGTEKTPMYFFNENDFNVVIQYDLTYKKPTYCISGSCTKKVTENFVRIIESGTNEIPFNYSHGYYISLSNLIYRENDFVYLKNKEEIIYKKICKICGDKNCLNDGLVCNINSECGSGNCILGKCSSDTNCYNNDCNCSIDQIQYNNRCISKHSVAIGGIPTTENPEECVTNYISAITGKCAVALGDSCNKNLDCAENYCILGICSDNDTNCYKNNCNCKEIEIQFENRICILKNSVDVGEKTITGNKLECKSNLIDSDTNFCKLDCNSNQISYNYGCITKKTAKNGVIPQTKNREECKSEYINPKTGKCSMTYEDIIIIIIIILLGLIFGGGLLYYLLKKNKTITDNFKLKLEQAREERRKAQLEYNTAKAKKETSEKVINKIAKELDSKIKDQKLLLMKLKQIEKIKHKTTIDLKKLKEYKNEITEISFDVKSKTLQLQKEKEKLSNLENDVKFAKQREESLKKDLIKITEHIAKIEKEKRTPYKNKQGVKVFINEDGYEVFANNSKKLFHRWWYERKHRTTIGPNYEIHHKDGDKTNNNIDNLEKLSKEEHRMKH